MKTVVWLAVVAVVLFAIFVLSSPGDSQTPASTPDVAPSPAVQATRPETPDNADTVQHGSAVTEPVSERGGSLPTGRSPVEAPASAATMYPTTEEMVRTLHRAFVDDKERTMAALQAVADREQEQFARDRELEAAVRNALEQAIANGRVDSSALQALSDITCYPSLCRIEYGGGLERPPIAQIIAREASKSPVLLSVPIDGGRQGWEMFVIRETMVFHMPDLFGQKE